MSFWKNVENFFCELVFPEYYKCIFCGKELYCKIPTLTCDECQKKLPYIGDKICLKCGDKLCSLADYCLICKNNKREFDIARAPFVYEGLISSAIVKFKFQNAKYLFKPLSAYMAKCYYDLGVLADLVVSVPMTEEKQLKRGYNQSSLLAQNLCKYIHLPFEPKIIKKIKNTDNQVDLAFEERNKNVKGAFLITDRNKIKNKVILLVDDVLTTGATCDECSKLLKKAGAKKVVVLCLARTHIQK